VNLFDSILAAQDGGAVRQLSESFGLSPGQTTSAIANLLPALSSGLKRNVSSEGGLQGLVSALSGGDHSKYLDDPSTLGTAETVRDGNGILGHILGSKEVSRNVAQRASEGTGIGVDILKKMLPVVATLAMGALSKQTQAPGFQSAMAGGQPDSLMSMLAPLLDADKDGSAADDIVGMLGNILGRK